MSTFAIESRLPTSCPSAFWIISPPIRRSREKMSPGLLHWDLISESTSVIEWRIARAPSSKAGAMPTIVRGWLAAEAVCDDYVAVFVFRVLCFMREHKAVIGPTVVLTRGLTKLRVRKWYNSNVRVVGGSRTLDGVNSSDHIRPKSGPERNFPAMPSTSQPKSATKQLNLQQTSLTSGKRR